jgi:hypothetical protein
MQPGDRLCKRNESLTALETVWRCSGAWLIERFAKRSITKVCRVTRDGSLITRCCASGLNAPRTDAKGLSSTDDRPFD